MVVAPPKRKATPSLPVFGDSYMADTRHLSLEEHGAYFLLLLTAWQTDGCRLPDDDVRIARTLAISPHKWAKLKPTVMDFWRLENGWWTQGRLSHERQFVDAKRQQNADAAKKRWDQQAPENKGGDGCERITERNAPPPPPPPLKGKKKEEATPLRRAPAPLSEAVAIWVEHATANGWKPKTPTLGDKRSKRLSKLLHDHGLDKWREAIERAASGEMLRGPDPAPWFTFDFLIDPDKFLRTLEGNYDKQFGNRGSQQRGSNWSDAYGIGTSSRVPL